MAELEWYYSEDCITNDKVYIKSEVDRKLLEKDLVLANIRWQYAGMRFLYCPRRMFNFWRKVKDYWRNRAEKIKKQLEEMK